jgi:hypothetical protein
MEGKKAGPKGPAFSVHAGQEFQAKGNQRVARGRLRSVNDFPVAQRGTEAVGREGLDA